VRIGFVISQNIFSLRYKLTISACTFLLIGWWFIIFEGFTCKKCCQINKKQEFLKLWKIRHGFLFMKLGYNYFMPILWSRKLMFVQKNELIFVKLTNVICWFDSIQKNVKGAGNNVKANNTKKCKKIHSAWNLSLFSCSLILFHFLDGFILLLCSHNCHHYTADVNYHLRINNTNLFHNWLDYGGAMNHQSVHLCWLVLGK